MDEDIMFLGNWSSQHHSSSSSFVSAIVLTPMNKGVLNAETTRTYSRSQSLVVHIGRHISNDTSPPADDKATYSNPVMSRNHAKITFSDSGPAFLIDTGSHHGTFVARTGSGQFKLEPESSYQLQDDDKITFGKEVQRDDNTFKPLTVSVKLLSLASTPSSMSISSAEGSPISNFNSPKRRNRFGLSPSSDGAGSSSDSEQSDSEINPEYKDSNAEEALSLQSPKYHTSDSPHAFSDGPHMSDGLSSSPRVELEGPANPVEERSLSPVINLNSHSAVVPPPWRLMNVPWAGFNAKICRHMPNVLAGTPSRFDGLFGSRTFGRHNHPGSSGSQSHHNHFENHGFMSRHNDRHHVHEGNDSLKEEITSLDQIVKALNTDVASLKETFEKGDDLVKDKIIFDKVEELFGLLRTKLMQDVDSALSANINGLNAFKDAVASLQNEMTTLKSHKGAVQTDLRFLRSDHDALQTSVAGFKERLDDHDSLMSGFREDIERLRDAGYFDDDRVAALEKERPEVNNDLLTIKANVQAVENGLQALLIAVESKGSNDSIKELSCQLAVMKAELQSRIEEEIKAQLKATMESEELSSVLGKRKRRVDDEHDASEQPATSLVAIPTTPSRKRLKIVADCVAAGAIGAISAWIGLAFL